MFFHTYKVDGSNIFLLLRLFHNSFPSVLLWTPRLLVCLLVCLLPVRLTVLPFCFILTVGLFVCVCVCRSHQLNATTAVCHSCVCPLSLWITHTLTNTHTVQTPGAAGSGTCHLFPSVRSSTITSCGFGVVSFSHDHELMANCEHISSPWLHPSN